MLSRQTYLLFELDRCYTSHSTTHASAVNLLPKISREYPALDSVSELDGLHQELASASPDIERVHFIYDTIRIRRGL